MEIALACHFGAVAKCATVAPHQPARESQLKRPLKVAWFSYFPIEWMPDLPAELQRLPRMHPATWQRVLWEEFKSRNDLELDIIVLRGQFPKTISFDRDGTRFHCIRTPPASRAPSLYWMDTFLINRLLKKIQPDVVHAWGTEYGAAAIATRLRWPALITMQGILEWYGSVFPLHGHQKLGRWLEKRSLPKAKVLTAESSFAIKYLGERYPKAKLLQVEHAPNPVFSRMPRHPLTNPPRLVCVGTFLYWKGADVVLKALNGLLTDHLFELVWIGSKDEALEKEIRSQTSPLLWDRVTFKHDLTSSQVAEELARAAVFIHAARADNSPNAVKEAVCAAVPVVATHTGGIPDYVFPGENGFLFESGDVEDCRAKIKLALNHPLFSRGQVEPARLQKTREYLSSKTMAARFFDGYKVALRGHAT